jgi:hypothetical protein
MGKSTMAQGKLAKVAMKKAMKKAKATVPKGEGVQKAKAKVHAMKMVMKKPVAVPKPEDVSMEEGEEEPHVQDTEEEDEEKATPKAKAKDYYHFNAKLATAPRSVQDAVAKIRALPHRSGKQSKLQAMAVAFATSGWNHKLFKSIEQIELARAQQKQSKAYPRQVMVTKCGGEDGFEKASWWTKP